MTADDRERRTARLAEAAAARTADAAARARRAITKLNATGQPITFVSVARTAGVSTSFLYQHPELNFGAKSASTVPMRPAKPPHPRPVRRQSNRCAPNSP
jgi:hypothetical protein